MYVNVFYLYFPIIQPSCRVGPVIGVVETRFGTLTTIAPSTHLVLLCIQLYTIRLPIHYFHTLSALDTPSQPHVLLSHVRITGCRPSNLTSRDYPSQAGNSLYASHCMPVTTSLSGTCPSNPAVLHYCEVALPSPCRGPRSNPLTHSPRSE